MPIRWMISQTCYQQWLCDCVQTSIGWYVHIPTSVPSIFVFDGFVFSPGEHFPVSWHIVWDVYVICNYMCVKVCAYIYAYIPEITPDIR